MKEFQLIEKYFRPLTNSNEAAQNLENDTAQISFKNDGNLVISKDIFVEDVHFLQSDGGFKIASKLLRTNLSDIASSGATPLYYMLGFSKNKNTPEKFISDFAQGLKSVQDEFKLSLIGGDTVNSEKLFFSITIFGTLDNKKTLARNQAKSGDLIFTSGTIGDAFLGLTTKFDDFVTKRHFFPTPRVNLGKKLLEKELSKCATDISDGLLADLNHICQSSKLDAEVFLDKIPLSSSAQKSLQNDKKLKILDLISGGDDYELIFTVDPKNEEEIVTLSKNLDLKLTNIGQFTKPLNSTAEVTLRGTDNQKINIKKFGYEH